MNYYIMLITILAIRIVVLFYSDTGLFADEAQYFIWSQDLSFGYYSKPPMIGWIIRLSTEIGQNINEFWIRLPAPIIHTITAIVVGYIAQYLALSERPKLSDCQVKKARFWASAIYMTMPCVSLSSFIMSTDVLMTLFWSITILLVLYGRQSKGRIIFYSALSGVAIGLGFLSKHNIVILVLVLLQDVIRNRKSAYPNWCLNILCTGLAALLICMPNVWWIMQNDMVTVKHISELSSGGVGRSYLKHILGFLEFIGAQFFMIGPIFMLIYLRVLWSLYHSLSLGLEVRLVHKTTIVPLVFFIALSAVSNSYANWAAQAYVGMCAILGFAMVDIKPQIKMGKLLGIGLNIALFAAMILVQFNFAGLNIITKRAHGGNDIGRHVCARYERDGIDTFAVDDRKLLVIAQYYSMRNCPFYNIQFVKLSQDKQIQDHFDLQKLKNGIQYGAKTMLSVYQKVCDESFECLYEGKLAKCCFMSIEE